MDLQQHNTQQKVGSIVGMPTQGHIPIKSFVDGEIEL